MLARRAQLRHDKYFSFAPLPTPHAPRPTPHAPRPTPHAPFPELYIGLTRRSNTRDGLKRKGGIARGLGIVWTCKQSELTQAGHVQTNLYLHIRRKLKRLSNYEI